MRACMCHKRGVYGACTKLCSPLPTPLFLFSPPLSPLSFSEVEELGSKELELGDKSIIIEIKANEQGKFVKILEVCTYVCISLLNIESMASEYLYLQMLCPRF